MFKPSEILLQNPFFQGLNKRSLKELLSHVHEKSYTKGEEIFAMGAKADYFFIILKGWVKLYRTSREGEEVIIHIFGPGESFAEAAVFSEQQIYPVNAESVDNTEIIAIPKKYFIEKIEKDSSFALKILGAIAARQHYLVQQLEQITARTAPQRIGTFLLKFCHLHKDKSKKDLIVELPYDKSLISARLNIKPETFSRALAKLEPHGIHVKERSILINNIKELTKFCDIQSNDEGTSKKTIPCQ